MAKFEIQITKMRYIVLVAFFIFLFASCSKDKFNTIPSLKYKNANTNILSRGQTLVLTLSFTDAEGDLTDSIAVQEVVSKPCANGNGFIANYAIPEFPTGKNQKGDILVTFSYNDVNPKCERNDTALFKFVLKDKAQNKSDTAVSEPIVIIY